MNTLAYEVPEVDAPKEEARFSLFANFDPRLHAASEYGLVNAEPTVLVVDDEFIIRDLIVEVLRSRGFVTLEAEDAEHAQKLLNDPNIRIDVLVSDIRLPGMDGRDLARAARTQHPELKVLFLSGYASPPEDSKIDESTDFMAKPFVLREVAEHVESLL